MFPFDVHKTTESGGMCKLYDPVQLNAYSGELSIGNTLATKFKTNSYCS